MKTDEQVIDDAIELVKNQWCQGNWKISPEYAKAEGLPRKAHYCAMGAIQKAAGTRVQTALSALPSVRVAKPKIAQVTRIAERLARVIQENTDDDAYEIKDWRPADEVVEAYNDQHSRRDMLAMFEKLR
jgi:hypothetical protein